MGFVLRAENSDLGWRRGSVAWKPRWSFLTLRVNLDTQAVKRVRGSVPSSCKSPVSRSFSAFVAHEAARFFRCEFADPGGRVYHVTHYSTEKIAHGCHLGSLAQTNTKAPYFSTSPTLHRGQILFLCIASNHDSKQQANDAYSALHCK